MLTPDDKRWIRAMVRREFRAIIDEMVTAEQGGEEREDDGKAQRQSAPRGD